MKKASTHTLTFRGAVKTAARSARLRAFRRGLPVAISRNGKVVLIYKNKREIIVSSSGASKSK